MTSSPPPLLVDHPRLVDAALLDHRLAPPAAPPTLGSGSTARLRDRMARFSSSMEHRARRDRVDGLIAELELSSLYDEAIAAADRFLARGDTSADVVALASTVPTVALAAAMGWSNAASDALVSDVQALAAAVGRGEPATVATDAAVDRLLARATDHGGDVDAGVSLLYQNADATKALLLATAAAEVDGHPRESAVRQTVRVAAEALTLTEAEGASVEVAAGSVLQLDLVAGDREFGHGHHACPGRALAETIVDASLDVLRRRTDLAAAQIVRDDDGKIITFHVG